MDTLKKKCLFQCEVMVSWLWMDCGYYPFLDTSIFVHMSMLHMNMSPQKFHFASIRPLKKWLDQVCDFWVTLQSHQIWRFWLEDQLYKWMVFNCHVWLPKGIFECCEHPKYKLANPPLWESFTCNRLEQPWQIWLNTSNNYPLVNQHSYGKSQFLMGK